MSAPFWEDDWDNAEKQAAHAVGREALNTIAPVAVAMTLALAALVVSTGLVAITAIRYPNALVQIVAAAMLVVIAWKTGCGYGTRKERKKHVEGKGDFKPMRLSGWAWVRLTIIAGLCWAALSLWWPLPWSVVGAVVVLAGTLVPLLLNDRMKRVNSLGSFLGDEL